MDDESIAYGQSLTDTPVSMLCVDQEENPIAGVEVHLFQYSGGENGKYEEFGPFMTNEEGKAICDEPMFSDKEGRFDRWFYARVPGELVGAARSVQWRNEPAINAEGKIVMQPSRSVEGTVTVPEGFDPSLVKVRVQTMHIVNGPGPFDYASMTREPTFRGLDTALADIFEPEVEKNGHVVLHDVPMTGRVYLVTRGKGLAEAQWRNEDNAFDEPIRLEVVEEGVLFGRVLSPEGEPLRSVSIKARLSGRGRMDPSYLTTFTTATNDDGEYRLEGLPHSEVTVTVEEPMQRWMIAPRDQVLVETGEQLELDLHLEDGVQISGQIVDSEGMPVEGAAISAITSTGERAGLSDDVSDEEGRYALTVPSGPVSFYFNALPSGFAYPEPQIILNLNIEKDQPAVRELNFELKRR